MRASVKADSHLSELPDDIAEACREQLKEIDRSFNFVRGWLGYAEDLASEAESEYIELKSEGKNPEHYDVSNDYMSLFDEAVAYIENNWPGELSAFGQIFTDSLSSEQSENFYTNYRKLVDEIDLIGRNAEETIMMYSDRTIFFERLKIKRVTGTVDEAFDYSPVYVSDMRDIVQKTIDRLRTFRQQIAGIQKELAQYWQQSFAGKSHPVSSHIRNIMSYTNSVRSAVDDDNVNAAQAANQFIRDVSNELEAMQQVDNNVASTVRSALKNVDDAIHSFSYKDDREYARANNEREDIKDALRSFDTSVKTAHNTAKATMPPGVPNYIYSISQDVYIVPDDCTGRVLSLEKRNGTGKQRYRVFVYETGETKKYDSRELRKNAPDSYNRKSVKPSHSPAAFRSVKSVPFENRLLEIEQIINYEQKGFSVFEYEIHSVSIYLCGLEHDADYLDSLFTTGVESTYEEKNGIWYTYSYQEMALDDARDILEGCADRYEVRDFSINTASFYCNVLASSESNARTKVLSSTIFNIKDGKTSGADIYYTEAEDEAFFYNVVIQPQFEWNRNPSCK